jgi:hypothetical protein
MLSYQIWTESDCEWHYGAWECVATFSHLLEAIDWSVGAVTRGVSCVLTGDHNLVIRYAPPLPRLPLAGSTDERGREFVPYTDGSGGDYVSYDDLRVAGAIFDRLTA